MGQRIGYISFLVRDYDEAISDFTGQLGFELIEDTSNILQTWASLDNGKRVGPDCSSGLP
jgi:catechol 2,3-dioxygenase-like lactoylglutathione lyase family enzyme